MIEISMRDANDFIISVTLDGENYKLRFGWNDNSGSWSMDFRDSNNEDIARGIAVVPNFPLLQQYRRAGLPRGELMAVVVNDDEPGNQAIPRDGFAKGRFKLIYVPEAEKNAIVQAMEARVQGGLS